MKLLSIDVGIKNLAYCLFDFNLVTREYTILLWDVINLCGKVPNCSTVGCKKVAKFMHSNGHTYLCPTHAKKSTYIISTANLSLKKFNKMKLADLQKVIKEYTIPLTASIVKKEAVLKTVLEFMAPKLLQSVTTTGANDLDLIKLGVAMRDAFDTEFEQHLSTLDHIVIENQISPIANRMKTLQGMIAQYFIMHNKIKITFVSAANKLKGASPAHSASLTPLGEKADADAEPVTTISLEPGDGADGASPPDYAARKKEGIKITLSLIINNHPLWLSHFNQHKKKDDLADAFLQGKWFLHNKV
jgi:hypothetical protein